VNPLAGLSASARQSAGLAVVEHRTWPLPTRPWRMGQSWECVLVAHWRADVDELRPLVSPSLEVQTFDGSAWLGIMAFRISAVRLRGTLPVPGISSFLELNVRTYVTAGGRPGIWFFSLDASSQLAVEVARRTYALPYFRARMTLRRRGEWIEFESARVGSTEHPYVFSARYRPRGAVAQAAPGSIEEFLVERYCLYAVDRRGRLCRADIHHPPWPLQKTDAEVELTTMAPPEVRLPEEPPLTHFAAGEDVVIWPLERVSRR
jgi:uncharacterized protein YqjF (DUF2071 family)